MAAQISMKVVPIDSPQALKLSIKKKIEIASGNMKIKNPLHAGGAFPCKWKYAIRDLKTIPTLHLYLAFFKKN